MTLIWNASSEGRGKYFRMLCFYNCCLYHGYMIYRCLHCNILLPNASSFSGAFIICRVASVLLDILWWNQYAWKTHYLQTARNASLKCEHLNADLREGTGSADTTARPLGNHGRRLPPPPHSRRVRAAIFKLLLRTQSKKPHASARRSEPQCRPELAFAVGHWRSTIACHRRTPCSDVGQ